MTAAIRSFSGEHRFLSNFHVEKDGLTVEHRFAAAKTLSPEERAAIMAAHSPGAAKRLGRRAALRPDWEDVKVGIMLELLQQKFTDPELRTSLAATGDAELVEGNTWSDRFWGVDLRTGAGRNVLGRTLMLVRATLP
ncbi:NADAR family protein [Agromyces sp. NPDC057679]|uniref:NADAR family protein n=1 Tax=Agromyces sp. NPDC057679 TaxID=3346207 RepID=UPI003672A1F2